MNGVEVASATYKASIGYSTDPFAVGAHITQGASYFNGFIDEVRFYNRALTAEEIQYNYQHPDTPITDGLVLWLDFNEGSGTTAYDKSGNGNDGTIYGAIWTSMQTLTDDSLTVKSGVDSLKIVQNGLWRIRHEYSAPQTWEAYDAISFWWYGNNTGKTIQVKISSDPNDLWNNYYYYGIEENWSGWRQIVIPFSGMTAFGNPSLNQIQTISITYGTPTTSTTYLDLGELTFLPKLTTIIIPQNQPSQPQDIAYLYAFIPTLLAFAIIFTSIKRRGVKEE
jgi:hypothetical protein